MSPKTLSMPSEDLARPEPLETPGRQLRALREARRLDIDRVAAQLHLQRHVVEWLESDQYDRLPAPVFVTGYIRNYARLLGVDPTPLVAAYRALVPPPEPGWSQPARQGSEVGQPKASGRWGWALGILVLALAGGGVGLWLHGQRSTQTAELTAAPPKPEAEQTSPAPAAAPAPLNPAPPESIPLRDLPRVASSQQPPNLPEPIAPAQAVVAPPPAIPSPPAEEEAETAVETAPPAPVSKELVFEFTGTSWVDVRAADGKSILTGRMRAGDRRVVQGEPPYKIVIGNAAATRLTVGGQPIDLKARAQGNVARFSFDPFQPTPDQRTERP